LHQTIPHLRHRHSEQNSQVGANYYEEPPHQDDGREESKDDSKGLKSVLLNTHLQTVASFDLLIFKEKIREDFHLTHPIARLALDKPGRYRLF
jgi:hypothetical protein